MSVRTVLLRPLVKLQPLSVMRNLVHIPDEWKAWGSWRSVRREGGPLCDPATQSAPEVEQHVAQNSQQGRIHASQERDSHRFTSRSVGALAIGGRRICTC